MKLYRIDEKTFCHGASLKGANEQHKTWQDVVLLKISDPASGIV